MTSKHRLSPRRPALALGIVLIAAVCLAPPPASAREGESGLFDFYSLELEGSRQDRTITDLDGDGLLDIAMVISKASKPDTYWLRTCLQKKGAGFGDNCSATTLPGDARAFDIGEVDGNPGAELIVIGSGGVKMGSFGGGKFGSLSRATSEGTILSGADGEAPRLLRFLWDIDGDGKKEAVLPGREGPGIFKHSGSGLSLFQRVDSPAYVTYRVGSRGDIMATDDVNQFLRFRKYAKRTAAHYVAPDVFVEDFNGDKKPDMITLVDNTLRVFFQGEDGRFPSSPSVKVKKSILPPEEKGVGLAGEAMTFWDLNGDGMGDIIMMKWGSSQERTQMDRYIYYAKPGFKYNADDKPDQVIRSESAAIDFGIHDLNNDGRTDLVIPFFHFAPAQAFKVMTENAIKVQFRLFLMTPEGRYSQGEGKSFAKVDRRVQVNYKIDVLGMIFDFQTLLEGKFIPLITFGYDFNGDGYADLVADSGGDRLEFYWGNEKAEYARLPDHAIDYESAMDYDLADLNGDGKCDIITYYESKERTEKKREIARLARDRNEIGAGGLDEAALTTPEGTRIKVLISK